MIPVYNQIITEDDAKAVYETVKSQYVTHIGKETNDLESTLAKKFNRKYALACSNGTTALHLALVSLRLEGKTIAVPACAFAAVAFAPAYIGCKTIFIDVNIDTWNMDLNLLEKECKKKKIDAVIYVHNYGNPIDYDRLLEMSNRYKFYIIEDACEAMGSKYKGKLTGKLGDVSVFSFYGNKVITGGEGGALLTDLNHVNERAKLFRGQALSKSKKFWHEDIGHNFRITNMQSSLILSQLKRFDETINKLSHVKKVYEELLPKTFTMQRVIDNCSSCWWMISVVNCEHTFEEISKKLKSNGFDSRPIFRTLPYMPPWKDTHKDTEYPRSEYLTKYGITLPSGPNINDDLIGKICQIIKDF
jgi:perosamine synthetase